MREVTSPGLSTFKVSIFGPSTLIFSGICFRFKMISVASSTTPGMDENSCMTPSIRTAVMAAPSIEDSSTRRRALPTVVPKPRSNGCAENCPYLSVSVSVFATKRFGFWNPFQSIAFKPPLGPTLAGRLLCAPILLFRVKFDDHLFLNRDIHVLAFRQRDNLRLQTFAVQLQPGWNAAAAGQVERALHRRHRAAGFFEGD